MRAREAPSGRSRLWPGTSCPRPGGVCGRRIWLEGRGQSWPEAARPDQGAGRDQGTANASRRPPGARPTQSPPCWPHCPEGCRPRAARVAGFPPPAQPREGPAPHSSSGGTVGFVYSFIYLECVYTWGRARAMVRVGRSENNLLRFVFSFHHVVSGN